MPAAAIAAPIVGGIAGQIASSGDINAEQGDLQNAINAYKNVNIPTIQEQQWNLAQEQNQGALSPEAMQTLGMGSNAMAGIQTSPAYAQAQQAALAQLGQLGQGGLTNQERQNLIQANLAASGQANSANAAVSQQMAARGMGGSGAQLAAELSNSQNSANMLANQSNAINAMAQNNALSAIQQQGLLGGQMQAQQFGQQAAIAQAQNAINQFNAANAQNVNAYNTQAANQAQAQNLANQQNIANTNTNIANQQQAHNTGLYQQQFQNQMQQAAGEAGAYNNMAGFQGQQGQQTAGMWAGIGSGLGSAANAYQLSNAISGLNNNNSNSNSYQSSPSWNEAATSANNYGAQPLSMPQMGSQQQSNPYNVGYFNGGNVGYAGSALQTNPGGSGASLQPTYAEGGKVDEHNKANLEELKHAFAKFITEEEKEKYAGGGVVLSPQQIQDIKNQALAINQMGGQKNSLTPGQMAGLIEAIKRQQSAPAPQPSPANYAVGGVVEHHKPRPHKPPFHEQKGHVAVAKEKPSLVPFMPKYNYGGEVSTLGMNSYDGGGEVQPNDQPNSLGIDPEKAKEFEEGFNHPITFTQGMNNVLSALGLAKANAQAQQGQQQAPAPQAYADGGQVDPSQQGIQPPQINRGIYASRPISPMQKAAMLNAVLNNATGTSIPQQDMAQSMARMIEGGGLQAMPQGSPDKPQDTNDPEQVMWTGGSPIGSKDISGAGMFNGGGSVSAKVSPGERYYTPQEAKVVDQQKVSPKEVGRVVPGKAPVKGDSPKNDIVSAKLEKGGIVIPRSVKSDEDILNFVHKVRNGKRD